MTSLRRAVYKYSQLLLPGYLIQRYKRFLADVSFINNFDIDQFVSTEISLPKSTDELSNPSIITVHCPNTGE